MNRDTSIYLDGVRLLAALLVVAGHVEWTFAPGLLPFIRNYHFATLAVGIFFVLSGFVIAYAVDRKETDALSYFLNRAARVYSVVVPVLLLTLLLDIGGRLLAPDAYDALNVRNVSKELAKLFDSLTFDNQAWRLNIFPGYNPPFWSLGYEVPYYVAFGLWFFGGVRWRLGAIALMAAAGPYIALLFGLWLLGFCCYQICQNISLTPRQGRILLFVSLLFLGLAPIVAQFFSEDAPFGGGMIGLVQFFAAGIPFAGTIVGFVFADFPLSGWGGGRLIQWAAGATFTIYLLHYPLGYFLHAVLPYNLPLIARWVGIFSFVVVICFVVAEVTERRKKDWRQAFVALLRLLAPRAMTRSLVVQEESAR